MESLSFIRKEREIPFFRVDGSGKIELALPEDCLDMAPISVSLKFVKPIKTSKDQLQDWGFIGKKLAGFVAGLSERFNEVTDTFGLRTAVIDILRRLGVETAEYREKRLPCIVQNVTNLAGLREITKRYRGTIDAIGNMVTYEARVLVDFTTGAIIVPRDQVYPTQKASRNQGVIALRIALGQHFGYAGEFTKGEVHTVMTYRIEDDSREWQSEMVRRVFDMSIALFNLGIEARDLGRNQVASRRVSSRPRSYVVDWNVPGNTPHPYTPGPFARK
ncbi:MAG: hypothetical protein ABIE03_06685 [Patescibacteria group bacterium]|nr:hypothetical protein [Patescibacteria group bacterium]